MRIEFQVDFCDCKYYRVKDGIYCGEWVVMYQMYFTRVREANDNLTFMGLFLGCLHVYFFSFCKATCLLKLVVPLCNQNTGILYLKQNQPSIAIAVLFISSAFVRQLAF